ncbi:alpha/beta hydrolase [Kluyvera georgiana]|uniref:alpha/beta hydrolase n=1 Tax=Kluyvera georgiana TaxID=73098 RepID=UPI00322054E1
MNDYVQYAEQAGVLDPQAVDELRAMEQNAPTTPPDLLVLRDAMGWTAKDIHTRRMTIRNQIIDGHVNVRIYRCDEDNAPTPAVLFLHGGGFFGGSLDNVEYPCRALADIGGLTVVSVDYALAPERPHPAALMDCYTALRWLYLHAEEYGIDKQQIVVAGDSAGGNLSLATALLDVSLGTRYLSRVVGYYPATTLLVDTALTDTTQYSAQQHKTLIDGYLNGFYGSMGQVAQWYAGATDCQNPFISPLYADPARLAALPPMLICCGEFDPLRLQVEAFVAKARAAGAAVTYVRYCAMVHAFMDKVGVLPQAETLLRDTMVFIRGEPLMVR